MKRLFDLVLATAGIVILLPLGLLIALLILLDTGRPVFFSQVRTGRGGQPFYLYKFRTMYTGAEHSGQLTVGSKDQRITRTGYWLRQLKLDELLQLWNVLKGDMSLVGPRPEVPAYVNLYTPKQKQVLRLRPGITDWASVRFRQENKLLEQARDPEAFYREKIMPVKLKMNLYYLENRNLLTDIKIILLTLFPFLRSRTLVKLENETRKKLATGHQVDD